MLVYYIEGLESRNYPKGFGKTHIWQEIENMRASVLRYFLESQI
jgi:hypothetical protein